MEAILIIIYIAAGIWAINQLLSIRTQYSLGLLGWGGFLFRCLIAMVLGWALIIIAILKLLIVRSSKNREE